MAKVDVISSCLLGMASNATSNTRMELTPLDLRLLPVKPIQRGLIYPKPHQSQEFEFESFINHLKNSLALTLNFFPPLAGRLGTLKNEDDDDDDVSTTVFFFLDCNNAGVEFTHAVAHVSVSDILEPVYVPEIVSSFFPLNGISNYEGISNPLFAVQVTELVDGYFIGCTANHVALDGVSFWHFVNSWSEISRGSDTISKNPVFERCSISDNSSNPVPSIGKSIKTLNLNFSSTSTPPLLRRVFHFSKENIAKLKAKASFDKISSLQAISAHLWRSVIRLRRSGIILDYDDDDDDRKKKKCCSIMFAVDVRTRIPLPDGYFGNAAYFATTATSEIELLDNGFKWAALKINEFVAQQTREAAFEWLNNTDFTVGNNKNYTVIIGSSPRHNVYGNDFGWGKPVAVRCGMAQGYDGLMVVFPAPEYSGGGIQVIACLDLRIMRAIGEDEEFMEVITV